MSPMTYSPITSRLGFPRVSGDEPLDLLNVMRPEGFSPRERG